MPEMVKGAEKEVLATSASLEQNINNAYLSETDINPRRVASILLRRRNPTLDERTIKARERLGNRESSYLPLAEKLAKQLETSAYNSNRKIFYAERFLSGLRLWIMKQREFAKELAERAADTTLVCNGKNRLYTTSSQGFGVGVYMRSLAERLKERGVRAIAMLGSVEADTRSMRDMTIALHGSRYVLPPPGADALFGKKVDLGAEALYAMWGGNKFGNKFREEDPLWGKSVSAIPAPTQKEVETLLAERIYADQRMMLNGKDVDGDGRQSMMRSGERLSVLLGALSSAASVAKSYDEFMQLIETICFSPLPDLMLVDEKDIMVSSKQEVIQLLLDKDLISTLKQAYFKEAQSRIKVVSQERAKNYIDDETLVPLDMLADSNGYRREGPLVLYPDGVIGDFQVEERIEDVADSLFLKHGLVVNLLDLLLNANYCSPATYMPASYHLSRRLFEYLEYKGDVAPRVKTPRFTLRGLMMKKKHGIVFENSNALLAQVEGPGVKRIEEEILRMLPGQQGLAIQTRFSENYSQMEKKEEQEDAVLGALRGVLRKARFLPEELENFRRAKIRREVRGIMDGERSLDDLGVATQELETEFVIEAIGSALPRRRMVESELASAMNVLKNPVSGLNGRNGVLRSKE